ncbi:hypothetical protein AY555_06495 [Haematospirillum jordaniae]|uniref:Uncharacterized protein n=1 Tax=Haematospirillum jordaniae TaxID=1549855 RepID=A0A143DDV0_9PROT|nr:phage tail protein [Haematospirillum jordaniae]AMW34885.1 hypothetical protein AY555_06495 [Haematospirillum jordaniae]
MSAPHYYTLVTDAGHTRLTEALATSKPVVLTHFAFGDGDGAAYDPTPDQTALRREVWRTEINSIRTDPKNPAWLTVEAVIPARVGGWTVREAGVFDADGILIAVAKYPESFKPQLDDGVGKDLCCRMILQHGNVSAVTLKIDPSVVLATRDHVSAEVAAAIASHAGPGHSPPDASTTVKGLVELATTAEARAGSSTHLAVTPAGLKAAMDAATPITPGIVRLATADEVKAGTDAEKAVTPAALAQAFPAPVGSVIMHAGQEPPPLYLKCNGALLSRAAYPELFTVIGTTFGSGDGSTTFAVPDLRGEFLRGWDDGRGVDSGRAFGSAQSDDFESHSHVSIGRSFNQGAFFATTGGYGIWPNGNIDPNYHRTSSEGGAETRPRNIALLACIRYR